MTSAFILTDQNHEPHTSHTNRLLENKYLGLQQILRPHRKHGRPKHLGSEQGSTHSWDLQVPPPTTGHPCFFYCTILSSVCFRPPVPIHRHIVLFLNCGMPEGVWPGRVPIYLNPPLPSPLCSISLAFMFSSLTDR